MFIGDNRKTILASGDGSCMLHAILGEPRINQDGTTTLVDPNATEHRQQLLDYAANFLFFMMKQSYNSGQPLRHRDDRNQDQNEVLALNFLGELTRGNDDNFLAVCNAERTSVSKEQILQHLTEAYGGTKDFDISLFGIMTAELFNVNITCHSINPTTRGFHDHWFDSGNDNNPSIEVYHNGTHFDRIVPIQQTMSREPKGDPYEQPYQTKTQTTYQQPTIERQVTHQGSLTVSTQPRNTNNTLYNRQQTTQASNIDSPIPEHDKRIELINGDDYSRTYSISTSGDGSCLIHATLAKQFLVNDKHKDIIQLKCKPGEANNIRHNCIDYIAKEMMSMIRTVGTNRLSACNNRTNLRKVLMNNFSEERVNWFTTIINDLSINIVNSTTEQIGEVIKARLAEQYGKEQNLDIDIFGLAIADLQDINIICSTNHRVNILGKIQHNYDLTPRNFFSKNGGNNGTVNILSDAGTHFYRLTTTEGNRRPTERECTHGYQEQYFPRQPQLEYKPNPANNEPTRTSDILNQKQQRPTKRVAFAGDTHATSIDPRLTTNRIHTITTIPITTIPITTLPKPATISLNKSPLTTTTATTTSLVNSPLTPSLTNPIISLNKRPLTTTTATTSLVNSPLTPSLTNPIISLNKRPLTTTTATTSLVNSPLTPSLTREQIVPVVRHDFVPAKKTSSSSSSDSSSILPQQPQSAVATNVITTTPLVMLPRRAIGQKIELSEIISEKDLIECLKYLQYRQIMSKQTLKKYMLLLDNAKEIAQGFNNLIGQKADIFNADFINKNIEQVRKELENLQTQGTITSEQKDKWLNFTERLGEIQDMMKTAKYVQKLHTNYSSTIMTNDKLKNLLAIGSEQVGDDYVKKTIEEALENQKQFDCLNAMSKKQKSLSIKISFLGIIIFPITIATIIMFLVQKQKNAKKIKPLKAKVDSNLKLISNYASLVKRPDNMWKNRDEQGHDPKPPRTI